ncbi:MAG: hypothetical protein IPI30_19450 [Saprospiraceae bacterium]|nr:hypothetical protein [Candidatus Vicinibacter affinis]
MENSKYIGITIGPIYKTFQKAEKTREIWGASYLFSYLCKKLLNEITSQISRDSIILPDTGELGVTRPGVGLYPDRIIIKSVEGNFDKIVEIVKRVKKQVADEISKAILSYRAYDPYAVLYYKEIIEKNKKSEAHQYLLDYLQVYSLEVVPKKVNLKDKKDCYLGVVKSMNVMMDHLELRTSLAGFDPDPIKIFLRGINHSFLLKDAFHPSFKHFPSLPEISTSELRFISDNILTYDLIIKQNYDDLIDEERRQLEELEGRNQDEEVEVNEDRIEIESDEKEEDLVSALFRIKDVKDYLRTYHKYVAIVHADGDRMGTLIGSLGEEEVVNFSKDLLSFSKQANKILAGRRFTDGKSSDWGYGAAPIYIGGDDLVFFAPVASRVQKDNKLVYQTIFHLINDLDAAFNKVFNDKLNGEYIKYKKISSAERPCMSYGVSISYIKHPLREAFNQSYQLMASVKNDDYITRNRVKFKVQKHSGQWFGGIMNKNILNTWKEFIKLLDENNNSDLKGNSAGNFINSLSQKLRHYQTTIEARIDIDDTAEFKVSMEALFDNALDEQVHDEYRNYSNQIRDLLIDMLINAKEGTGLSPSIRVTEAIDTLHGILRFVHFIRDNEFRHEN